MDRDHEPLQVIWLLHALRGPELTRATIPRPLAARNEDDLSELRELEDFRAMSGSWPSSGSYYDEGWWVADGALSSLRRRVGANHRTLSTYFNMLRRHGFALDQLAEPRPEAGWRADRPDAAPLPVFLVARAIRS